MLNVQISPEEIAFFRKKAEEKIAAEKWYGRNKQVKIDNFVHCWITEEAFKKVLSAKGKWFRHRGLYVGDSVGAGADFIVKLDGQEVSLGLRSIAPDSLYKWKVVAYPDDRIRDELDNARKAELSGSTNKASAIADYHIVCNHDQGLTRFFGIISREKMLTALRQAKRLFSKKNQEYFRTVSLDEFSEKELDQLLEKLD